MGKPVILAVDDDPQVLRSIARDLRERYGRDYRVLRAESGAEALGALSEMGEPVALLRADQRMPQMDGVTFLSKAIQQFPGCKRALLTAYADTDAAIQAINQSQVDYYLLKPWDPPEEKLYPVLDDLLDDWRASYRPGFGGVKVVGDRWSARSHQIKDFLARNHVPYEFLDVETSSDAQSYLNGEYSNLPLVILPGGGRLSAPAPIDLATEIGLHATAAESFYDLVIIGAGPAGLASAVYAGSEGLRTLLVEREAPGGQAGTSSRIENYLGFPAGLSGSDLARRAVAQARKFEVEILTPQEVTELQVDGPYKRLRLSEGSEVSAHALMLATGVYWSRLSCSGADEFSGRGVYYGAALAEAMNCQGETIYTVGAGNSAGQAAIHFARYAERVIMLIRGTGLEQKMSQYLVHRIRETPNIEVRLCTEIVACNGEDHLEKVTIRNLATGTEEDADTRYVFAFIGASPRTEWLEETVARDAGGFILTGTDLIPELHLKQWPIKRAPFLLEASVPGIFAAGDVRHDSIKRVASAVGEGSVAIHFVHRHLATL